MKVPVFSVVVHRNVTLAFFVRVYFTHHLGVEHLNFKLLLHESWSLEYLQSLLSLMAENFVTVT